jgi:hypothetical protein
LAPLWLSLLLALEVTIFRRPTQIESELRLLIRRMSMDNPLWGAPRSRQVRRQRVFRPFASGWFPDLGGRQGRINFQDDGR